MSQYYIFMFVQCGAVMFVQCGAVMFVQCCISKHGYVGSSRQSTREMKRAAGCLKCTPVTCVLCRGVTAAHGGMQTQLQYGKHRKDFIRPMV